MFLATVIALGFTWLNSTWLSFKGFSVSKNEKLIDYYLSDFSVLNTYPNGNMKYQIKGEHLVHQQSTGASQIFSPELIAKDTDGVVITLTAKKAEQAEKNGPINLNGDVIAIKDSPEVTKSFELLTRNLTYNPLIRELSSEEEITLNSVNGIIKGQGFNTKLDEEELRIHKNVQAILIPSK
ncbi:hypothetical protein GCM10009133_03910 [Cocleimonas flava]